MSDTTSNYRYILQLLSDTKDAKKFQTALKQVERAAAKTGQKLSEALTPANFKSAQATFKKGEASLKVLVKDGNRLKEIFVKGDVVGRGKNSIKALDSATRVHSKSVENLWSKYGKLAARAVVVIPIWYALRNAFLFMINTIRLGVNNIIEIDKALARAKAVTKGTSEEINTTIKELNDNARTLSRETGRSTKDIIELYYRMATAGLSNEASIAGMSLALKTSIAIMGDTTDTAILLADIYNLMGDRIEGATTPAEKMTKIASTISVLWEDNAFTLDEFSEALKTWVPTAKNYNLTLDEMMALTASAATLMSRSATSGTQLSHAFIMLSKNASVVETLLSRRVDFNLEKPFNVLVEVLQKLNNEFKAGKNIGKEVQALFGVRGSKTIQSFASGLDIVVRNLVKLRDTGDDARFDNLNEKFQTQNDTLELQLQRLQEIRKQLSETFLKGVTGESDYVKQLKAINEELIRMKPLAEAAGKAISFLLGGVKLVGAIGEAREVSGLQNNQRLQKIKTTSDVFHRAKAAGIKVTGQSTEELIAELEALQESKKVQEDTNDVIQIEIDGRKAITGTLNENTKSLKEQLILADALKAAGASQLEIELYKLNLITDTIDKEEQRLKILKLITDEINDQAEQLKKSAVDALSSALQGEDTNVFASIGKQIRKSISDALAENLVQSFLDTTGLGEKFGEFIFGLKHGADEVKQKEIDGHSRGAEIVYDRIIQAYNDASIQQSTATGGSTAGGADLGKFGQMADMFGFGDKLKKITDKELYSIGESSVTVGTAAGAAMGAYSLSKMYKNKGSGDVFGGAFEGAAAGAAVGSLAGPLGAAIGASLGAIYGGITAATPKVTEEIANNTLQVASKIDVTNKQLEYVNRNLLALRQELTYKLPDSAYFSESTNIADQFSLHSRRGLA